MLSTEIAYRIPGDPWKRKVVRAETEVGLMEKLSKSVEKLREKGVVEVRYLN